MKKIALLLFHGIGKNSNEFDKMKGILSKYYDVYTPNLPGHIVCPLDNKTTCPRHIWNYSYNTWLSFAEDEFKKLKKKYNGNIFVGGNSFGATIALYLASKYDVKGIISISAFIFLSGVFSLIHKFGKLLEIVFKYKGFSLESQDIPLKKVLMVKEFIDVIRKKIHMIKAPILIMQSTNDNVVSPKSASYIYKNISSKFKKIFWFEKRTNEVEHGIKIYSKDAKDVSKLIINFVNDCFKH